MLINVAVLSNLEFYSYEDVTEIYYNAIQKRGQKTSQI
jgi:hypothetical protein